MAILRPFLALRPQPPQAALVASVPYDVVNREEARHLAEGNPLSFLHVSRPEIDLPEGTDVHSAIVYEKALENFEKLRKQAPLVRDSEPSLYAYRLIMKIGGTVQEQTGIAGTFSIDEYDRGIIKKHEKTRQDKEDDRTRHVVTLRAQTGPVFLAYRGTTAIQALIDHEKKQAPLYDFTAPDGVQHTVWKISVVQKLAALFSEIPSLYIADGHHRAASASRARREVKGSTDAFLAVAFPAEQLKILPYYRTLKDLRPGAGQPVMSAQALLSKLERDFDITAGTSSDSENAGNPKRGQFAMYLERKWYGLKPKHEATGNPIERLDVSVLQDRVLSPIFGIEDPRTDSRIDFVGGIRGPKELERLVNEGKAAVAFSLHPTTVEDLMDVSDSGGIMPPKSTWFEPKLRDGLLSHLLDN